MPNGVHPVVMVYLVTTCLLGANTRKPTPKYTVSWFAVKSAWGSHTLQVILHLV